MKPVAAMAACAACRGRRFVNVAIFDGRSTRRDCVRCGLTLAVTPFDYAADSPLEIMGPPARPAQLAVSRQSAPSAKTTYLPISERERQRRKSAAAAAAERDVPLRPPADLARRRRCLADPLVFLSTYFGEIFYQGFTADRRAMVEGIVHAASYGGDYALAGPRGEGKTKLALFVALWLILNRRVRLPIIIGKNQKGSENELANLKIELTGNESFAADFPEICLPLIALDGWASRARKQTAGGARTDVGWDKDCIILPTIAAAALPKGWPKGEPSLAVGQGLAVVGIDGRIRGFNRRNIRPDLAVIDDIDDRESARSTVQTADHETAIEQDIAGLAGSGQRVSRVMLCTVINATCVAAKYTVKPAWRGQRFKMLAKLPEREDLWGEYVELRRNRVADDPDARAAHRYYLERREEMDRGAAVSNPAAFEGKPGADGEPLEVSTLQACYNKIADVGWDAFCCEYQNDPPAPDATATSGITRELVQRRLSGLYRCELLPDSIISIGVDVGKIACHFVAGAFRQGGGGAIIDYGVIEVSGAERSDQQEVIERAILRALIGFKDQLSTTPYRDADGNPVAASSVLIDSGYCPDAVYELVLRHGDPFRAAKGIGGGRFRHGTPDTRTRYVGNHWFRQMQGGRLWLYSLDADHWKRSVHERFIAEPVDENNRPNAGSLSLYVPAGGRDHKTFSAHTLAEEWVTEFLPGKGERSRFVVHSANNHFLDATALCLAGAEMLGRGMFSQNVVIEEPQRPLVIGTGHRPHAGARW
jgi:hypothetical protein